MLWLSSKVFVQKCCGIFSRVNNTKMSTSINVLPPRTDDGFQLIEKLLIKAHVAYDINYRVYLANHLSHGLYTLCALGASKSRLQEFYDMYTKRLEPLGESILVINSSNWTENIGKENLYSDFMKYFDDEVNSKGMRDTFNLYYSQLIGESFGAALHPLINIGYAMEFSNPLLLSEGLAYTCTEPLKDTAIILDDIDSKYANVNTTIVNLIEELQVIQFPELQNNDWNFSKKVQFLLDNHGMVFKNLISKWDLTRVDQLPAKLNELTEASILGAFATYSKQIDFFLLHGFTGNHAVRIAFSHLAEQMQRRLLQANLLGLLTDYVVQRKPKFDVNFVTGYQVTTMPDETLTWDDVVSKAISIDEEHVLKVVRCLIYYMESVPMPQRSAVFSEHFLKRCAYKTVDVVQEIDHYIF